MFKNGSQKISLQQKYTHSQLSIVFIQIRSITFPLSIIVQQCPADLRELNLWVVTLKKTSINMLMQFMNCQLILEENNQVITNLYNSCTTGTGTNFQCCKQNIQTNARKIKFVTSTQQTIRMLYFLITKTGILFQVYKEEDIEAPFLIKYLAPISFHKIVSIILQLRLYQVEVSRHFPLQLVSEEGGKDRGAPGRQVSAGGVW
ncbi:Hypothetical_protein [Hexamita inflata]|uniref:Hypothetical_protein n=1 Tax=Hexamita inflata TaxID=28002 RepID=A0AA86QNF7_9EUKA|nr:Hypothetical protein HINF_LOCUS42610 [Hexamita inflata]